MPPLSQERIITENSVGEHMLEHAARKPQLDQSIIVGAFAIRVQGPGGVQDLHAQPRMS